MVYESSRFKDKVQTYLASVMTEADADAEEEPEVA